MVLRYPSASGPAVSERVRQTVALLGRRGYALNPRRLGELCLGGAIGEAEVRWAVASAEGLALAGNLVVDRSDLERAPDIGRRALAHVAEAGEYLDMTVAFIRRLVVFAPFIRSVSIAGSLASGGFRASDDVDLNLIVDDGHRHLAYVAVNTLGLLHAMRHRDKPVDHLTRRPVAPRLMTANLILERSQCLPLERQDADMAFELLVAEPVFGVDTLTEVIEANEPLLEHFPQLAARPAPLLIDAPARRLPAAMFPRVLDGAARSLGEGAWKYMQWTRRHSPEALARVAFVRSTMRPYALFDDPGSG